ncbi:MAG: Ldh family oxidoreductase [Oscillospiraceae bacterium]|nr:Ldh family oxidoreductase [Oscillospiraceae bacterium]
MVYAAFESTVYLIRNIFLAYGFCERDSLRITDALLTADLAGIESHGIQRMIRYDEAILTKMVIPNAEPEIIHETSLSAVIDAHQAMGQLISIEAMNLAINKAEKNGFGIVTVRNSNHFGIAGYYARMAAEKGLIGSAMTNSEAIMVPTNGSRAMLGTNPIAMAFPADPVPFCFDSATTVVPRGKLEVYRKAGKELPDGWAVDTDGNVCRDPSLIIDNISGKKGGGILPLGGAGEICGGHKGYGFGMICELFSSLLSCGVPSYESYTKDGIADSGHAFIAMNYNLFGNPEKLRCECSRILEDIRNAPPIEEGKRIYIHGEKEAESAERVRRQGIPANEKTIDELKDICRRLHIPFSLEWKEG